MLDSIKKGLKALRMAVAAVFRALLIFIYRFFFSWWLERKSYSDRLRERFALEIQERVACLFADYGARIISNTEEYPQSFDYAAVTVAIDKMLLRFIRGRMDFRVDVAPLDKPGAWREISTVARNSDYPDDPDRKVDYYGLNDFGRFFQSNVDVLRHEVSKPEWRAAAGWLVPVG